MVLDYNKCVGAAASILSRLKAAPTRAQQRVGAAFSRDNKQNSILSQHGGYGQKTVAKIHHQFPVLYIFRRAGDFFTLF
jgi:hypothetical protein